MATLKRLVVHIAADVKQFEAGIRKAQAGLSNFARKAGRFLAPLGNTLGRLSKMVLSLKGAFVALGAGLAGRSFLNAANTTEQLQVRLQALLGSVEEGNRLFKDMAQFAGQVPFEYKDIMEAATSLAGVMRGGVEEVNQWMPMIADLAAVSGLSIQETTSQIIRMYSAGAASADLFRERGILAMLGFQAGVSYSAEETRKRLMEIYPRAEWRGATKELAKTWSGIMSMLSDKWFQFRDKLMKSGLFNYLKAIAMWLDEKFGAGLEKSTTLVQQLSSMLVNGLDAAIRGIGYMVDGFRSISLAIKLVQIAWEGLKQLVYVLNIEFNKFFIRVADQWNKFAALVKKAWALFGKDVDLSFNVDVAEAKLAEWKRKLEQSISTVDQLKQEAIETFNSIGEGAKSAAEAADDIRLTFEELQQQDMLNGVATGFDNIAVSVDKAAQATRELQEAQNKFVTGAMEYYSQLNQSINSAAQEQGYLDYLLERGLISMDEYADRVFKSMEALEVSIDDVADRTDKWSKMLDQVAANIQEGITDAILQARSLSDVLDGVLEQIARMMVQRYITEPLYNAIDKGIQNIGTSMGFGGGKAHGGPVTAGTAYVVGEQGPELFVPSTNGAIVPNGAMTAGQVNIYQSISVRGTGDKELQMKLEEAAKRGAEQGYAKVANDLRRNGPLRRSIR